MATGIVVTDEIARPEFMVTQDFEALLTGNDVKELEDRAKGFGPNRRIGYAILSRSKKELLELANSLDEAADTYFKMLEAVQDYQEHLKVLFEQSEAAQMRILCMLATICPRDGEAG